jgi:26S proteasome regulatory subunit N1
VELCVTASFGLSLWDTDLGLSHVDKYTYSSEEYIKAGVLLATGILNSRHTEADVATGHIDEYADNKSVPLKTSAIMGLGLAYTGSHREDLLQLLIPHVSDDGVSIEIVSLVTLVPEFIFVGSKNSEITGTILQRLVEKAERSDTGLGEKWAWYMALGLGLLYLGTSCGVFPKCRSRLFSFLRRPARRVGYDHQDTQGY